MTQEISNIEWLKKEIELLKREVDLLKREIDSLKPNKLGQGNVWVWPLQQPGITTTPCTTPYNGPTCGGTTGLQAENVTLNT